MSPRRSQTAPRRKRAPRSNPSTSAASGTGSKNTAPYRGHRVRPRPRARDPPPAGLNCESETVGLEMPTSREISARETGAGTDRVQHGSLVEILEQRRDRHQSIDGLRGHLVRNPNATRRRQRVRLTHTELDSYSRVRKVTLAPRPARYRCKIGAVGSSHERREVVDGRGVTAVAVLTALMIAAAGLAATTQAEAEELTIWVGWSARELNEFKKVVAEYDKKNPNVTVKVVGSINDDKIAASLRSRQGADVVSSFRRRTSACTARRAAGSTSRPTSSATRST